MWAVVVKTSPMSRGDEETPAGSPRGDAQVRADVPVLPGGIVAGKYRIDAVIGFGGMGIACEGFHLDLKTKVEVQIARREHVNDERAAARFLSEARSAAQLRSQHTRRVLDCGRLDVGAPYMVVEHLDGADLRRVRIAHGRLPVEEAVTFVLQACEALGEAHSRGIMHGDLKPENLFLTDGPDGGALVKVLGLGVSKQLGRLPGSSALTESAESVGSPHYMSPEQMIDPTDVDARTDVWSLGVLLRELLTGELRRSLNDVDAAIPESLAAIVRRCMDRNRDARFPDATALGRALRAFGALTSSVTRERVEEILGRARSFRPESETSPSVADAPESVEEERQSITDMPASVVDVPDSVPPPPARSIPALPALPPPPLPASQSESTVLQSEPAATESVAATSHSVPARRPSLGTKPPPLPPSHSPPPPGLRQLVEKRSARIALAGVLLGSLVAFFASHRAGPASEPSSAPAASKGQAPAVDPAPSVVVPARPEVNPDESVLLLSAVPVASPAPPPRAQATSQERALEPGRSVAPLQKPAPSATPTPAVEKPSPARKRAWSPFPELKQPVLPPNVR
jgi:serine/threonine-protein kinase